MTGILIEEAEAFPANKADNQDRLKLARLLMDSSSHLPLDVAHISSKTGFSRFYFIRAFRRAFGITPHQYLMRCRIERAKELLASSELTVTEICFTVGFQSLGSFSTLFRRNTGYSPSAHRSRILEQRRLLHRHVPACFITMFALDKQEQL